MATVKNKLIFIAAGMMSIMIMLGFSGCADQEDEANNSSLASSRVVSVAPAPTFSQEYTVTEDEVVMESSYNGQQDTTVYKFENGALVSASFKRVCTSKENAEAVMESFSGISKSASQPMYENLKVDGVVFTCDYTDFALQDLKQYSPEELKAYLESQVYITKG